MPLAVVALWASGLEWHPANGLPLLVGPLAACLYPALWIALRAVVRLPLAYLKAVDTLLLALAPTGAVLVLGLPWPPPLRSLLWLPAAGLFGAAWWVNWMHSAPPARGSGALPPTPAFIPPVRGPVTAGYRSYDRSHTGVDIGVPEGTPVVAPAGGVVLHAGPLEQWGYVVYLDHGDGWSTFFAHLEGPAMGRGQRVETGEVIGWSGTSGISTGAHVHVELRFRGTPVEPLTSLAPQSATIPARRSKH